MSLIAGGVEGLRVLKDSVQIDSIIIAKSGIRLENNVNSSKIDVLNNNSVLYVDLYNGGTWNNPLLRIENDQQLKGNTFIGAYAGIGDYTYDNGAEYNTFIGSGSGLSITSGDYNTGLGGASLYHITTGSNNVGIGNFSGYTNSIGSYNVFLGYNSGYNTTIGYLVFIGSEAGYSNSTGNENVFIGYRSGYLNSTGSYNTYLGYNAGRSATSSNNVFIGNSTGYNSTGSYNTFIGREAGYTNTSGAYNTFIGHNSGYSNSTGLRNVFIGYKAGYNETGSDKLYIDNSDTSSPLIYGDFSTNAVTINGDLEVTGTIKGVVNVFAYEFYFDDDPNTIVTLTSLPTGSIITDIAVNVLEGFNDSGYDYLDVGNSSSSSAFLYQYDLTTAGFKSASLGTITTTNMPYYCTSSNNLRMAYEAESEDGTQGHAIIYIYYTTF